MEALWCKAAQWVHSEVVQWQNGRLLTDMSQVRTLPSELPQLESILHFVNSCGRSSVVERQVVTLAAGVRFPSVTPSNAAGRDGDRTTLITWPMLGQHQP